VSGSDAPTLRIDFAGDLKRVVPRPGDVFVLHVDHDLTPELHQRIGGYLRQALGDGVKCLVLARGFRLEVVGQDDAPIGG